jgi:quercetin dioxygenase-like cupin family protein
MAATGDSLQNPATGERIVFVRTAADSGGELLEMENVWTRADHRTQPHVHPEMEETWEVISGSAGFEIAGQRRVAGPGETVVAPPGTPHHGWNAADGETRLRITMRPALRWEEFVERLFRGDDVRELLREFSREVAPPPG